MRPYITLLRNNSDYTRLWLSGAVSQMGDWFNVIVLLALVSRYTNGSGIAVSLFLLARIVPPLLVTPYAGVLADRLNRKTIMIATDILRAIIVLMFLLSTGAETLWMIYALTVLQFSMTALFEPARSAILPNIVSRDDLITANTIGSITWSAMLAIGALIGGIVASVLGPVGALIIDALTYLVSAGLVMSIRSYQPPKRERMPTKQPNQILEGLRYARLRPEISSALIVKASGAIGSTDTLMTIFATQIFLTAGSNGEASLGLLYGATGVGAVLGPILLNLFHDGTTPQMRKAILIGFASLTIGWGIISQAPALWIVALGLGIRAIGGSANWTYSSAIIQKTTDDAYLGRMFSIETTLLHSISIVGTILTGALVDWLGASQVHHVALILTGLSTLPIIIWLLVMRYMDDQSSQKLATLPT